MKYLVFLLLVLPVFISCNEEESDLPANTTYLRMDALHACGSDLNLQGSESGPEWGARVLLAVQGAGIPILDSEIGFDESLLEQVGWCGNCAPSGDYLSVAVTPNWVDELQELGFLLP